MRIVFTGGGTGGHVFPVFAVARELKNKTDTDHVASFRQYFFSDKPFDVNALLELDMEYVNIPAGKMRLNPSIDNFFDIFKTGFGLVIALYKLFVIYPDVVFGKGGYASFPTLLAARLLGIPIIIHESDSVAGRVTALSARWASIINVSYAVAKNSFKPQDQSKVYHVGQPIRRELEGRITDGAREFLGLDGATPTIFVFAGSLGAQKINNIMIDALPQLVLKYNVIHQTGKNNYADVIMFTDSVLKESKFKHRYKPYDFLNPISIKMAAGASQLIIGRAGSSLFEIASWSLPCIVIPIAQSVHDHQRKNAYAFAEVGGGRVIEEDNLSVSVLLNAVDEMINDKASYQTYCKKSHSFFIPNAAGEIASQIYNLAKTHYLNE